MRFTCFIILRCGEQKSQLLREMTKSTLVIATASLFGFFCQGVFCGSHREGGVSLIIAFNPPVGLISIEDASVYMA